MAKRRGVHPCNAFGHASIPGRNRWMALRPWDVDATVASRTARCRSPPPGDGGWYGCGRGFDGKRVSARVAEVFTAVRTVSREMAQRRVKSVPEHAEARYEWSSICLRWSIGKLER